MIRRSIPTLAVAALALAAARPAAAQDGAIAPACANVLLPAADACQKSVDLYQFFAPQLGALVAGGNTELGRGGPLGGPGHFSIGVRANAMRSPVPQLDQVRLSPTGAVRSSLRTEATWVGFPIVDAAVGVFKGVPLGLTNVGGVDLLVNASYVPDVEQDDFTLRTTGGNLKLGYGARLGILQETALVPGVAISALRRELPTTSLSVTTDQGDRFGVSNARVRTDSWRLTASKNFLVFTLAGGFGQDRYDTRAMVDATVAGPVPVPVASIRLTQKLTRTNYFANFTLLNVPFFKLVGEIGRTMGGTLAPTYNSFGGRRPDAAYTYGSVGVRFGR